MALPHDRSDILRTIDAGRPVSEDAGRWAVDAGYAKFGEDGDLSLTQKGLAELDHAG